MTKYYQEQNRIEKLRQQKADVPIALGEEHTTTSTKDKKRYICPECRFPLVKISNDEYYCNADHMSFYPNEDNMRTTNKVSMPRTPEENEPLVARNPPDADEQYLNKDNIEPAWGLKAMSDSSSTLRITSVSEKDGAGRPIKRNRWS